MICFQVKAVLISSVKGLLADLFGSVVSYVRLDDLIPVTTEIHVATSHFYP